MRLAQELAGNADYARLVSCLRGADTMATLRKSDLIALTRAWNYRSAQWRRCVMRLLAFRSGRAC
jgi:hypothetical protein